ncbi:MFS-type efflux pump ArsJ specific for 1-arseno-3-phosphoglycerate [hydrothermal vent metagenome]|uniref:MFS-type efflux pump ArsJ specific for 1-arseno-3-phosphoglycerate n=1 Tax=hydrothermal vent metagenome TaxID=652676 RepID=A0A3B0ZTS7_9ZZZZ
MDKGLKNYLIITGGYWAFTITDGALRMLVVLYFHLQGYSPFEVAMLFLFYEFFGIVTNLVGGWLGTRIGLNVIMHIGMAMQVLALAMLMVPEAWLSVAYVMAAQALSGIAKDLNKMSAKASVKSLVPDSHINKETVLFRWVAILTGSKNALKGLGFFIGALLLELFEFRAALAILAGSLLMVLFACLLMSPSGIGKSKVKQKFAQVFSKTAAINRLSIARFFLFAARDVWFVVALPVYLYSVLNWSFINVGGFLALWVIGYGVVQASVPKFLRKGSYGKAPNGNTAMRWAFILVIFPVAIAFALYSGFQAELVLVSGLIAFGIVFAINSAVHSYLIVAWSDKDKVAMNVGFYYMANAAGRLTGTVLSGLVYQTQGLVGCLLISSVFIFLAGLFSIRLMVAQNTG